jgi:hypothetical protein
LCQDIVVEIPRDDARSFGKELSVFGERPAQGPELVFAAHTAAAVLRPHRQEIALHGPGDVNRGNVAKG